MRGGRGEGYRQLYCLALWGPGTRGRCRLANARDALGGPLVATELHCSQVLRSTVHGIFLLRWPPPWLEALPGWVLSKMTTNPSWVPPSLLGGRFFFIEKKRQTFLFPQPSPPLSELQLKHFTFSLCKVLMISQTLRQWQ